MKAILSIFVVISFAMIFTQVDYAWSQEEDEMEMEEGMAGEGPDGGDYEDEEDDSVAQERVNRSRGARGGSFRGSPKAPNRSRSERRIVRGRNTFSEPSKVKFFRSGKRLKVESSSFEDRRQQLLQKQKEALKALDE